MVEYIKKVEIKLSIIIVSWNCCELLQQTLVSIYQSHTTSFEVILVDNASSDNTLQQVRKKFPTVKIVANSKNLGFAKANNIGIEKACGNYILLFNPDAQFKDSVTLGKLLAYMELHPEVDGIGCRLVFENGRHQVGDAGYRPGALTLAAHYLFLSSLFPKIFRGVFLSTQASNSGQEIEVNWICGACFMIKRSIIKQIGNLNGEMFLYGEDIEWGCRISHAGYTLRYLSDIEVLHLQGGSQSETLSVGVSWIDGLANAFTILNPTSSRLYFKVILATGFILRVFIYSLAELFSTKNDYCKRKRIMFAFLNHTLKMK